MKILAGRRYLSPQEVADLTTYSPDEVRRACRSHELRAFQKVRKGPWNIPEDAISPWLRGMDFYGGDSV